MEELARRLLLLLCTGDKTRVNKRKRVAIAKHRAKKRKLKARVTASR